jgi:hypothetical protein
MKGINIFTANVIKDFPYNYDRIIQELWKKGNKKKKNPYFERVWNDATWHSEISDCVLSPQAYLNTVCIPVHSLNKFKFKQPSRFLKPPQNK